jgi:putative phosphoesterase
MARGAAKMMIAIISDIHGNLPALEAVLAEARHVDQVICLGDVVNYGPWSDECLELLQTLPGFLLLEGNHEALYSGKTDVAEEIPLVQQFFQATIGRFKRYDLIRNLPREARQSGYLFTHTLNDLKIYPDTPLTPLCDCFVGHTHCAFKAERHGRWLVNPGSVGQNRRKLEAADFALFDTKSGEVALLEIAYSAKLLLSEMRRHAYPSACIEYYLKKL